MRGEYKYKVSVVTAAYNVGQYLEEAIESIVQQTIGLENIQMVLVDDGSQDDTGEICDKYALKYPDNVFVIHKENGGVSAARNEGLEHVEGKYINFMDADDKLEVNALEKMYAFMEENGEWVDLVAIPLLFFDAKSGQHILNYKYKKTKIVDLKSEYSYIHLSVNNVLVKKECMCKRRFDTQLAYAEDARVANDILLDKMCYGVLSDTNYLYRKRESEDSAIDKGRSREIYYIPCMERFHLDLIKTAKDRKGYVPKFIQYACMYDLQWRVNKKPMVQSGVLNEADEEKYNAYIAEVLGYIDDAIIKEQKNISGTCKSKLITEKYKKRNILPQIQYYPNDMRICVVENVSAKLSAFTSLFEFLKIDEKSIKIEGFCRCFAEMENSKMQIYLVSDDGRETYAKICDRPEKYDWCMNDISAKAVGFCMEIPREEIKSKTKYKLMIKYDGHSVECSNIGFGKFFPLAKQLKKSYLYENGLLITYQENALIINNHAAKIKAFTNEKALYKEMLFKKDKMLCRGVIARILYKTLNLFKKKEIWLVSDRLSKADDNGEAFFTYLNKNVENKNIKSYFVIDKNSQDRKRIEKIGKTVDYKTFKYKILSLLCDKFISSQGEDYIFNRFSTLSYIYKDIMFKQKFVFLQHGVTQNDVSTWLIRSNKNIDIFVVTTKPEYQSIIDGNYDYDKSVVKLTGLPRHDYLQNNEKDNRKILILPTWRLYLAGMYDIKSDSRKLKSGFEKATYCKMYQKLFEDERLKMAAEKYQYKIQLMLHPTMPKECLEYMCRKENTFVEVLDRSTRYRDIFSQGSLAVTDYSSAVFDFAYLRKPLLYYQFDKAEFFSGKHTVGKGYFDYERDGFGEVAYTEEQLVDYLIEYMKNDCALKDKYRERIENTFPYHDRNNCKRVYEATINI